MRVKQQLEFDNPKAATQLYAILSDLIDKKSKNLPFSRHRSAKLLAVTGNRADIAFADSDSVIANVPIRQGVNARAGDEVYVLLINGSANNMLVDFSKNV